jgi:hypothetical protein
MTARSKSLWAWALPLATEPNKMASVICGKPESTSRNESSMMFVAGGCILSHEAYLIEIRKIYFLNCL